MTLDFCPDFVCPDLAIVMENLELVLVSLSLYRSAKTVAGYLSFSFRFLA